MLMHINVYNNQLCCTINQLNLGLSGRHIKVGQHVSLRPPQTHAFYMNTHAFIADVKQSALVDEIRICLSNLHRYIFGESMGK